MLKANCITYKSKNLWKRGILLLFVISFFSLFSLGITPEAEGQDAPKDYSELLSKAQAAGSVRIIVKLDMPFVPEGLLSAPQEAVDQQARISRMQDQLLKALSKNNVKGIKRFKHMPYIAMEADSTALKVLISNPLVISIEEDVPVPPTLNQSVPLINADDAWTLGYTGSGWAVAILDTGVDKTHSFFSGGKVVAEACFSTTSPYSTTVCPNGKEDQTGSGAGVNCSATIYGCDHGTHVAGIAAGKSETINGVAKDANIIAVQIFSKFDSSTYCGADTPCALSYTSNQILGLEHVYSLSTTYNIAAVNMSLGGGAYSSYCDSSQSATKAAIDNLRSAGIATVISSGNDGYCGSISEPACISTAVSVGATTKSDQEAIYNNYASILALFAPGSSIYSSIPGNSWKSYSGTSMAAPHVTGAWAILKQASSSASVPTILSAFQNTGVSIADACSRSGYYPQRRIDVLAALNSLIVIPVGTLQGTVTSAFTTKPIANARINLNPPVTTALTNSIGFYQYLNLPAITYDVTASAFRYTASTANSVSVPPSGTVTQDFSLACNASFTDISPGYWAENYIKEMYCRSITAGCSTSPLKYCPNNNVTRAQMAKFIIRGMGETPSAVAYNTYFDDIANDLAIDGFAGYINRMRELGITTGCGTRLYCPNNSITRGQMAKFIIRGMGETPSAVAYNTYFDDIANDLAIDGFAGYINRMWELGITTGCGTRLYCPSSLVSRAQTAVFIIRAF